MSFDIKAVGDTTKKLSGTKWFPIALGIVAVVAVVSFLRGKPQQATEANYSGYPQLDGTPAVTPDIMNSAVGAIQQKMDEMNRNNAQSISDTNKAMSDALKAEHDATLASLTSLTGVLHDLQDNQTHFTQQYTDSTKQAVDTAVQKATDSFLQKQEQNPATNQGLTQEGMKQLQEISKSGKGAWDAGDHDRVSQLHTQKVNLANKMGLTVSADGTTYDATGKVINLGV